jgi:hypothetical protein
MKRLPDKPLTSKLDIKTLPGLGLAVRYKGITKTITEERLGELANEEMARLATIYTATHNKEPNGGDLLEVLDLNQLIARELFAI